MKNRLKPCTALMFTCLFLVFALSMITLAQDTPRTIQLDLKQPLTKQEQEEDLFTEKYEEVMGEISISDEAATVVDNIKLAVEDVSDVSMDIMINEIRGRRNEVVSFQIMGSVEKKVARVEFNEPSTLRGMISVADQAKMELRTFQPVINMITIQTLEDASKEAVSAINLAQITTEITSYFDFSQYHVKILETVEEEDVSSYLLEVDAPDDQIWQVWVSDDSWIPHEIIVFEGDTLLGTMQLSNVQINLELSLEQIVELPDVKEERI